MRNNRKISLQTIEESITHAIVKARGDVNKVLDNCGYEPLTFGSESPIGIWRVLMRHYDIASLKWKIKESDTVFIQFPWIHHNKKEFYDNLFNSGARIECVVHDLDSFRDPNETQHNDELEQLNRCHSIIAHTPAMKDYLIKKGVDGDKIKLLYLFPYLTDDAIHTYEHTGGATTIIFAGNLVKSPFVNKLHGISSSQLRFNLYGKGVGNFHDSENVKYKGIFEPDHPGGIEGEWGLVWDGEDIETCSGIYGDYLRYNSSHKISLYLSLGIPVVIWSQSSLRDFICSNNLGIAIDSIAKLEHTICSMSASQAKLLRDSAGKFAPLLRNGDILKKLIV